MSMNEDDSLCNDDFLTRFKTWTGHTTANKRQFNLYNNWTSRLVDIRHTHSREVYTAQQKHVWRAYCGSYEAADP